VAYASEYIVIYFAGKLVSCIKHIFRPASSKKTYWRKVDTEQEFCGVRLVSICLFEGSGMVGSIKIVQFPLLLRISTSKFRFQ